MQKTYLHITILLFIFLFCGNLYSQQDNSAPIRTGIIMGRVLDSWTNETLPCVVISLNGTPYQTTTDFDGNYKIINISPGRYSLNASVIGYQKKMHNGLNVTTNDTIIHDFHLDEVVLEQQYLDQNIFYFPRDSTLYNCFLGKIVDYGTKEPISNAIVSIEESSYGGVTDSSGMIKFQSITFGTYNIKVSHSGYRTKMFTDILMKPHDTVTLTIELKSDVYDYEDSARKDIQRGKVFQTGCISPNSNTPQLRSALKELTLQYGFEFVYDIYESTSSHRRVMVCGKKHDSFLSGAYYNYIANYLDIRNGKGWEKRLEKKINEITKSYNAKHPQK